MERTHGPFELDALVPAQFYANFRQGSAAYPERRLMLAVLQDALECFRKYAFARDSRGRQMFIEAKDWIFSRDQHWWYSFENICELLGFDPEYLRRQVETWYAQASTDPQAWANNQKLPRRRVRAR
ncbi:MAG: hypothetical protein KatS3mg077_2052 [Candidatus Binatia bacterium]|nr:MAG: hypothetical protein KatS3mg077_2052 [Candidatus Binatia bacterium]